MQPLCWLTMVLPSAVSHSSRLLQPGPRLAAATTHKAAVKSAARVPGREGSSLRRSMCSLECLAQHWEVQIEW